MWDAGAARRAFGGAGAGLGMRHERSGTDGLPSRVGSPHVRHRGYDDVPFQASNGTTVSNVASVTVNILPSASSSPRTFPSVHLRETFGMGEQPRRCLGARAIAGDVPGPHFCCSFRVQTTASTALSRLPRRSRLTADDHNDNYGRRAVTSLATSAPKNVATMIMVTTVGGFSSHSASSPTRTASTA